MIVISTIRGGGKTKQAIQLSHETGAILVCTTIHAAFSAAETAKSMRLHIPKPISIDQLSRVKGIGTKLIIDNIEHCILTFLDIDYDSLLAATITHD